MGKENEETFIQMILTFQKELSFLIYANVYNKILLIIIQDRAHQIIFNEGIEIFFLL